VAAQLNGLGESETTLNNQQDSATDGKTVLNYSIPLNQPRVQVQMISGSKKNSEHTFEICVLPIPRSNDGFWSKFSKDSAKGHRWILKSETEEDMVDWIVEIKKKIDSYVPERPPSPLFKVGESQGLSRSATQKSVTEHPEEDVESDGSLLDVPLDDNVSIGVI
jgi:hypothetical protein